MTIDPANLTPADRLRGITVTIRQMVDAAKAQMGIVGRLDVEILFAVRTPQGMGVIGNLPADAFLADIEAVTAPPPTVSPTVQAILASFGEPPIDGDGRSAAEGTDPTN